MGSPRQGYWSELPFPSPGDLLFPTQGLNPCLLQWQVDPLPLSHQGSPLEESFIQAKLRNTAQVAASQQFRGTAPLEPGLQFYTLSEQRTYTKHERGASVKWVIMYTASQHDPGV